MGSKTTTVRTKSKKGLGYDDLKEIALELYMSGTRTQKEICQMIGVTEPTFTKWKRDNGWDNLKQAILGGRHQIQAAIYRQVLQDVTAKDADGKPARINYDGLAKASKALQAFSPRKKVNLDQYTTVLMDFTTWLLENGNHEMSVQVSRLQNDFIDHLIQEQL